MKIALLGHGNTGKEIEAAIKESGKHEIVSVSTKTTGFDEAGISRSDVVIDFSAPLSVMENIKKVSGMGKNLVIGTSGWYEKVGEAEKIVKENGTGLIYGQNFSIGTNIFFKLAAYAASLASKFGDYDVYGLDVHHKDKKDSPSGTAFKIAEEIISNFPSKKIIQAEKLDRAIRPEELHFASIRAGRNPGMHKIVFDSAGDQISLEVSNHSRRGYAEGALMAAEFIQGKKGIFSFDQLFK